MTPRRAPLRMRLRGAVEFSAIVFVAFLVIVFAPTIERM